MKTRIVLATPHARFDALEARLRSHPRLEVHRVRAREKLSEDSLKAFDPAYIFFPQWSWKIPAAIHDAFNAVIFHMTDLPFGRGGSPLQNLIVRGHAETRLSALKCVEALDAGPVYAKRPLSLLGTAEEILLRAGDVMHDLIVDIALNCPEPVPQEGEAVVFQRRKPADSALTPDMDLTAVYNHIRMLDGEGYPPAFIDFGNFRMEFSRASLKADGIQADVRVTVRKGDTE